MGKIAKTDGSYVRSTAIEIAKAPVQLKVKKDKKVLPEDVKPIIVLESPSGHGSIESIYSKVSFRHGMTDKEYWKKTTDLVEKEVQCKSLPKLPRVDYSAVLPPIIKGRVKKIMSYDFSESDDKVYIRDQQSKVKVKEVSKPSSEAEPTAEAKVIVLRDRKVEESFNESDLSDIDRMEHEFQRLDLKIDVPLKYTVKKVDKKNWMSKFLCNPDRVVWDSKVYEKENTLADQTLDEQAEQLMNMSAQRFVEWLKSIGSGESIMTAEDVKDLFSINGDRTVLESIKTDPKRVNAIAKTVADKFNRPDIVIETHYEDQIKYRVKQVAKKKVISAFGRTIPQKERPWYKSITDVPIISVYPKELLTREKIFGGIRHLRSVKALIEFYLSHPQFDRPEYLVKCGDFKIDKEKSADKDVPLYEKLGLKY